MHRDTLHDRPSQAGFFDESFAFFYLFDAPHFAVGNVVQGGDDAGGAGLAYVLQADGVVGPVPTPGLFAEYHDEKFFLGGDLEAENVESAIDDRYGARDEF